MNKMAIQSVRIRCPGYDLTSEEAAEYIKDTTGFDPTGSKILKLEEGGPGWLFVCRDIGDFKYGISEEKFVMVSLGTGELKAGVDSPRPWGF